MKKLQHVALFALFLIATFLGAVTKVGAEELTISDNGGGSTNEVKASASDSTNVSQNNAATVQNTVDLTANTGSNTASDNSGDGSIATGNVESTTTVSNTMNTSSVKSDACCPSGLPSSQGTISGNGSDSRNTLTFTSSFNGKANTTNTASVTNAINGSANTGGNTASGNLGNVSIVTGNISVAEQLLTEVNSAKVVIAKPGADFSATVEDNGSESTNAISFDRKDTIVAAVNNQANIFNDSFWELVTGDNTANDNNGDVAIATGDIAITESVISKANNSEVVVTCCKKEEHTPQPVTPPEKPITPKSSDNSGGGPGNSSNGTSASTNTTDILPVTGNLLFYLALAANIMMLICGTYLRLRSGRSPSGVGL